MSAGPGEGGHPVWSDAELLVLMREHAPAGIAPETMLPALRGLVAGGADPRTLVAAVEATRSVGGAPEPVSGGPVSLATADARSGTTAARRGGWRQSLRRGGFVLFWLLVWELADRIIDNRLMLAGPLRTLRALGEQIFEPAFWEISAASLGRIVLGFSAALAVGIALALIAHRLPWFRELLAPLMSVVKTVPVISFIIMLLIWLGGSALTSWLGFLIVLPLVYTSMVTGLGAVSVADLERARVFRISRWKRFWYLSRPAFMPFLTSACRVGVGMSWRAGVMAELFANTPVSIGREMFTAKTFLDTPTLFAWTVVVMLLSIVFERAVLLLLRLGSKPCGGWLGSRP